MYRYTFIFAFWSIGCTSVLTENTTTREFSWTSKGGPGSTWTSRITWTSRGSGTVIEYSTTLPPGSPFKSGGRTLTIIDPPTTNTIYTTRTTTLDPSPNAPSPKPEPPIATVDAVKNLNGKQLVCNNSPLLCERAYNNVTYMGSHNAAFVRDRHSMGSGEQVYDATVSLAAGIRLLQSQVHEWDNRAWLCHGNCLLISAGSLQNWLYNITLWLYDNPFEVVTLILANPNDLPVDKIGEAVYASGLVNHAWYPKYGSPSPPKTWPTLGEMIAVGRRVVIFITSWPKATKTHPNYPYLLSEFDYVFETHYDNQRLEQFNCTAQRPGQMRKDNKDFINGSAQIGVEQGYLPLLNHFLYAPLAVGTQWMISDVAHINDTNSPSTNRLGSLSWHARECAQQWSVNPTFVLVDFFHRGPTLDLADSMNGILGKTQGRLELNEADGSISGAPKEFCKPCGGADGVKETRCRAAMGALVGFLVAVLVMAG